MAYLVFCLTGLLVFAVVSIFHDLDYTQVLGFILFGVWTTPRTWVADETITAAIMNTHVRDNLNDLDSRAGQKPFIIFLATANQPPSASFATPDFRNNHPILDFVDASTTYAIFSAVLGTTYDGGGLTVDIYWMSTTTGNCVWQAQIESHTPDVDDLDSDSWGTAVTATGAAADTSGESQKTSISMSTAQIDGLLAGESFRVRIARLGGDGSDTLAADAELMKVVVRET